jgi:hypothetical protein
MKRFVIVGVLACGGLVASPVPASASLMDWLQELSGPGPFNATNINWIVDVCPSKFSEETSSGRNIFASAYKRPKFCFFFDHRRLKNDEVGDNFGAGTINVQTFEFGVSAQLHRSLSVGFGLGRIGFKSERDAQPARLLVTIPRIVVKPALIFGDNGFWNDHESLRTVASILNFYIKNNIISGKLTGADFGLSSGEANGNFAVSHDRVWSSGFVLDFTEVLALVF